MAKKTKLQQAAESEMTIWPNTLTKVLERYFPRNYKPDKYELGEMMRGIQRGYEANPFEFEKDHKMIPELEELRRHA